VAKSEPKDKRRPKKAKEIKKSPILKLLQLVSDKPKKKIRRKRAGQKVILRS
jgi:hypothetical protein